MCEIFCNATAFAITIGIAMMIVFAEYIFFNLHNAFVDNSDIESLRI